MACSISNRCLTPTWETPSWSRRAMMNGDDPTTDPDRLARIERALAEDLQAVESETAPEPAVWLARYPDLRPELGERLAAGTGMRGRADPQRRAANAPGEGLAGDAP